MSRVNRAVILAAGLGTRLKWLTSESPKAMMDVGGEPAIVRVIRRLAGQGIHDIAINVHHHAEKLTDYLQDGSRFGVRLCYSREETLLDSGGGVRKAMDLLPGSGLVAVHNSDVMADVEIQVLAEMASETGASLALVSNPAHHPDGDFSLTDGMVTDNRNDGGTLKYTYSGVSVWDETALLEFDSGDTFSLIQPIRQLMKRGKLAGYLHRGLWFDIGRPRDLMQARLAMSHEQAVTPL